eukprot:TRINITY_DN12697_c0_g1_i1.p1 TRINITY_DN12697_c0_g1~~TRINITY_DN12697_c0_g1_i1.p1  ORF type:complete len:612 (-),score=191.55 TRINITY_DN12697_c0_g1_i1:86-1921(-)
MKAASLALLAVVAMWLCVASVSADVYGHNPRFSNNRLNGRGANRANNNRMCDTQNNAKGGYCWGPSMYYYVGSMLPIEYTAQHSCNNAKTGKQNCEIVLQYMCGDEVRDGATTDTIPDEEATYNTRVSPNPMTGEDEEVYLYGMHESYQYYQDCKDRERNKGLFLADQNLRRDKAQYTRQDRNGNRNGFECPEERDYYPYWHPTPWKDLAVLVSNPDRCGYYQKESQNVKSKNFCSDNKFATESTCKANGGVWESADSWDIDPPACREVEWSRDNHLGNGKSGFANMFNWTIPDDVNDNCVVRIRYNITTGDYDGWDARMNADFNGVEKSPVTQDPDINVMGRNLTLALNTDQTGRTFQDRTHTFAIRKRPDSVPDSARIWNLNVRGKRGNIVQVYPAVEYDFVPNYLHSRSGDYVHFQWTGCDTNPANNDGEGTAGTDRSNIVQLDAEPANYPGDQNKRNNLLFSDEAMRKRMAYIDQDDIEGDDTKCLTLKELNEKNNNNQAAIERDVQNCAKLNAAGPYFDGGVTQLKKTGGYEYMSTRNNNFSNRSQKGEITVKEILPSWSVALVAVGAALFMVSALVGITVLYSKSSPDSKVGRFVTGVNNKLTQY